MPSLANTTRAILVITLAVAALALGDALIKLSSGSISLWQMFVLRSALVLPVLLGIMALAARASLALRHPGWTPLRSLILVAMWLAYYAALPHVPLSLAAAGYYTSPLFITLFGALATRSPIAPRQWLAVAIGFAGVLLIIKPTASGLSPYALLPLLAAMLYAVAMLMTGTRCRKEHPLMLSAMLNVAFILTGGAAFLLLPDPAGTTSDFAAMWTPLDAADWRTITILAAAILIGSIGAAYAYQNGPPAVIGTFDFTYVGFSALWGWLLFTERPDALSSLGIALIVAAGVLAISGPRPSTAPPRT